MGKEKTNSIKRVDIKEVHELNERTKELQCVYRVFKLFRDADIPHERILQKVADLIPSGWQFPLVACARIVIGNQEYRSQLYVQRKWLLVADIIVNKEKVGAVEVAYTEIRPESYKGPFLEEEVLLLEAIASLIGYHLRQKTLEDDKAKLFRDVQRKYEKILSGFIPICASCKKIKDEQGVWHPLETYVQSRTEATFSHGICPDCVKKLYPHFQRK